MAAPLANMFYYGKEFGTKNQKVVGGKLLQAPYKELSTTQAGAELGQSVNDIAEPPKTDENQETQTSSGIDDYIKQIMAQGDTPTTTEELLRILGKG